MVNRVTVTEGFPLWGGFVVTVVDGAFEIVTEVQLMGVTQWLVRLGIVALLGEIHSGSALMRPSHGHVTP